MQLPVSEFACSADNKDIKMDKHTGLGVFVWR